ncbi:thymidine phosphorylase [[Mycoplasma] gypis]|uniref:Thymidine phosphorylase n=1 Tax=[Mycoplasma] gypis TaxID=92404 RepID=A0ABZ2RNL4_9BACT|nr:thymidine phosphorylase [[Mycoplasma] gypis]
MRMVDLIELKATNHQLTKEQIQFIIENYTNNNIPDYQMSSFLMAIRLNGMSDAEIAYLTEAMMHSGKVLDWSYLNTEIVDKHSTGGVGDKTSLVLMPLLASLGLTVAKMSGRGLAQTGGTIDKLETISGFKVNLSDEEFKHNVKENKIALVGQDEKLVPADKKIYALRDVTATVQSIPLIASSIMSKKLATGSNVILLDVKCGSGAFMKNVEQAQELAKQMISIGKNLGRKVMVEITNMQQPLGRAIGNKNEVLEAIETLKGHGPENFTKLIYSSASAFLVETNKAKDEQEAFAMIDETIKSNKAYDKFKEWIAAQGGNVSELEQKDWFKPKYTYELKSQQEGYLEILSALDFGLVAMKLGAGRKTKEDKIDFEAGIYLNKITNEYVKQGETLFTLTSSNPIEQSVILELEKTFKFNSEPIENPIVLAKMR